MIQKVLDSKFQVKTFSVKYNKELSKRAKIVLQSFKLKFYYYVIDDILYFLKSDSNECNCLEILNSTAIFLQNNLSVNFFDIYVYDIQINEISKTNRFTRGEQETVKISNTITIKLAYQVQPLEEILDTTW
jgi:hypothetical protein